MNTDFGQLHKEFSFTTSRSSGSGGQHVNKVETKVTLRFDVQNSQVLSDAEKILVLEKLKSYINKENQIVLHQETDRSQLTNKVKVVKKFDALLCKALKKQKKRKPTRPSAESIRKNKESKMRRSEIKANRGRIRDY